MLQDLNTVPAGANDHFSTVLDHIWKTYKARFNAHRRMLRVATLEAFTIVFISVCVVLFNLITLLPSIGGTGTTAQEMAVYSLTLSVAIIAFSVYSSQNDAKLKAYHFLQCAQELQVIYDSAKLQTLNEKDIDHRTKVVRGYHDVLKRYQMNHSRADYLIVLIEQAADSDEGVPTRLWRWLRRAIIGIRAAAAYVITMVAALGIAVLLFTL